MNILLLSDTHFGRSNKTYKIWEKYWKKHIAPLDFDLIIVAGDLASDRLRHFGVACRFFRLHAPGKKIVAIRGNHDLWEKEIGSLEIMLDETKKLAEISDIHLLQDHGTLELDECTLVGWDGWYKENPVKWSNDFNHIPRHTPDGSELHDYLHRRAYQAFNGYVYDEIFAGRGKPIILVTHMPCLPGLGIPTYNADARWGEQYVGHVFAMCFGHTHQYANAGARGTRVFNVGSDYDKPGYILFNLSGDIVSEHRASEGRGELEPGKELMDE